MTRLAIVTDLNRCVGCLSCMVACKSYNGVPIGSYWLKVLRVGPNGKNPGDNYPNIDMYFLPVQCQHCANPECVKVCPTQASYKAADGTVQIDKSKCIGCQFCVMACPYGVRYLNEEERVVEKCTLCEQKIAQGGLPQCVDQCCGRARFFGDLDKGIDSFVGPNEGKIGSEVATTLGGYCRAYDKSQVHQLPDVGNGPSMRYILRKHNWQGEE